MNYSNIYYDMLTINFGSCSTTNILESKFKFELTAFTTNVYKTYVIPSHRQ